MAIEYQWFGDGTDHVLDYSAEAHGYMGWLGTGDDSLIGSDFSDFINGASGNDTIDGGGSKDVIIGGQGIDVVIGGSGNDKFLFYSGDLVDMNLNGGDHDVILDFHGAGGYMAYTGVEDDMMEFYHYGAGSHLDFVSLVGGDPTKQLYAAYGTGGAFEGHLEVHMADGSTSHLVYGDYRFMA